MIMITGIGRSGTAYIAKLLRSVGLDVGHESFGRDGVVSWYWAAYLRKQKGLDRLYCRPPLNGMPLLSGTTTLSGGLPSFETVLHQVRDPIRSIPSFLTAYEPAWKWVYANTEISPSDPPVKRCCEVWLHWNRMAEGISSWTYRVESLESVWSEFSRRVGIQAPYDSVKRISHSTNSRPHPDISWDEIRKLTPLWKEIEELAVRYGYQIG